ncbi:tRNA epoxyqueuosine(34) reductase QueG, partial [Gammaproteobacteria bacterium]|nr:tRNA epoxyqueuosine(34) reductase QueG [Gammaproteobacteria bacterium]
EFEKITIGSAIRRVSYPQWIRNLAIALGNAPTSPEVLQALEKRLTFPDEMVLEHVNWAILEHKKN